ncbi:hypothetical protein ES703_38724 [subsurface metagenome]
MDKENPKVSVIICCYTMERLHDICQAVDSVLAQSIKPFELIICVDHNEELIERLKAELPSEVKVVLNKGAQGFSATKNVAIRTAIGDIIVFLDDDSRADSCWLQKLSESFQNQNVVAVGGRTIPLWLGGDRPKWFPEELDWIVGGTYKGLPIHENVIRNVSGGNSAFSKQAFEVAGLFRENFGRVGGSGVGEEAEFCLRLKNRFPDALILYEPQAVSYHKVPPWRLALKYIVKRSFSEGVYKSKLKNLSLSVPQNQLSTESSYLRYLLFTAIPERLRCFWKEGSLSQVGAITISIAAAGMGYLVGRVKK